MNKKFCSLILALPVCLASCHGATISRDNALEIVTRIEGAYKEELPFNLYTLYIKIDENIEKSETKYFYSSTDKYFYTYSVKNGEASESWQYVKSDDEGNEYFYLVNRVIDSSVNTENSPRYTVEKSVYDEEIWTEKDKGFKHELVRRVVELVDSAKSYLNSEPIQGSELTLESYGENSLFIRNTVKKSDGGISYEREVEFSNNLLVSYLYKADVPSRNRTYSVSYEAIEILYPKIG